MTYYEVNVVRGGEPTPVVAFAEEDAAIELLESLKEALNIHLSDHTGSAITAELYEQDFLREGVPLQSVYLRGLRPRY